MKTRIQLRGTCAICTKQHAATDGKNMALHGYTVDWGMFNNSCYGARSPHLGHKDAPEFIASVVKKIEQHMIVLPKLIKEESVLLSEARELPRNIRNRKLVTIHERKVNSMIYQLETEMPNTIELLNERIKNWVESPLIEVDLDIEEAEERKAREAAAAIKKEEKAIADAEKAERIAARDKKAADKMALLLSNQWRVIELEGEVVAQWQESFENEYAIMDGFRKKLKPMIAERCLKGLMTIEDAYYGNYKLVLRSRTEKDGKGKQLERFAHSLNFMDIASEPTLAHLK